MSVFVSERERLCVKNSRIKNGSKRFRILLIIH